MTPRPGDVVVVNFPGVTGIKRRPAVILSSDEYRSRPDAVIGLITSQTAAALGPTDHTLRDWRQAGLHRASAFRSFFVTLPRSSQMMVIGQLSAQDWEAVSSRVKKALAVCG